MRSGPFNNHKRANDLMHTVPRPATAGHAPPTPAAVSGRRGGASSAARRRATERPHGRAKYQAEGCRCAVCSAENAAAARRHRKARKLGNELAAASLVPTNGVRRRLEQLAIAGVGLDTIAERAAVSRTELVRIRSGKAKKLQRQTRDRIMGVSATPAPGALVDAGPSWALIVRMGAAGRPASWVAGRLGQGRTLRLGHDVITQATAAAIRALADEVLGTRPAARIKTPEVAVAVFDDWTWQADGLCRTDAVHDLTPEGIHHIRAFVPSDGDPPQWQQAALEMCRQCPVREACLRSALAQRSGVDGVWGGTTKGQRARMPRAAVAS